MNDLIRASVATDLGTELKQFIEVMAGQNNRLFLVDTETDKYLLKVYLKDKRNRLNREFGAFKFLRDNGIQNVPRAILKNEELNYGIYSYETGTVISSTAAGIPELDLLLNFILDLKKFQYGEVSVKFDPAVMACLSLQDYLNNIQFRFDKFQKYISTPNLHPSVNEFINTVDVIHFVDNEFKRLENIVSNFPVKELTQKEMMLNPVDFGFHNALRKPDNSICFVDFEYFGWDDPARLVADFVHHDMQSDLPNNYKEYFIDQYVERSGLSEGQTIRLHLVRELIALEWLTVYLYGMTPEKIATRIHANPDYNIEKSLNELINKVIKRYFLA